MTRLALTCSRGPAGGTVPLLVGPVRRPPGQTPERLHRHLPGRHPPRLQRPLRGQQIAGVRHGGCLLSAFEEVFLRARRHRVEQATRQDRAADFAADAGGSQEDRRAVRRRARDCRRIRRTSPCRTQRTQRAGVGRSQGLDAGRAKEAVAPFPGGQSDRLHARALGAVRQLLRRRPHLILKQCSRESAQGYCPGQKIMAVRGLGPWRRAGCGDVHADRLRQAQRCRSSGLARRCPGRDRGDAAEPARRAPSLELGPPIEARPRRIESAPAKARPDPSRRLIAGIIPPQTQPEITRGPRWMLT